MITKRQTPRMNSAQRTQRRRLLFGIAIGLAVQAPVCRWLASLASRSDDQLSDMLMTALGLDRRSAAIWFEGAAGRQLAAVAAEYSLPPRLLTALTTAELRAELRRRIQADYSAGRIVDAGGWRLTITEALALTAIYHGHRTAVGP
jgi:hypothetical protein